MRFYMSNLGDALYTINHPERIPTPRLVLFEDRILANIERMKTLLAAFEPVVSLDNLCPHVKTHKSVYVTRLLQKAGISFFKSSMNEIDMLVKSGAKRIFIAYPLLRHDAKRCFSVMQQNPEVEWFVQVSQQTHIDILLRALPLHPPSFSCYIDVDVGMHRTGVSPDSALSLYRYMKTQSQFRFAGLHAYDGHIHTGDSNARNRLARESMHILLSLLHEFKQEGIRVAAVMVGGTPGFLADLDVLLATKPDSRINLSPGTWIYSDSDHWRISQHHFQPAAHLLAQVIDIPAKGRATLNIGHKRWSIDQGVPEVFNYPDMRITGFSEEHTVVEFPLGTNPAIGDYILIVPRHVCSTVNLWEYGILIGADGEIKHNICIEARNR